MWKLVLEREEDLNNCENEIRSNGAKIWKQARFHSKRAKNSSLVLLDNCWKICFYFTRNIFNFFRIIFVTFLIFSNQSLSYETVINIKVLVLKINRIKLHYYYMIGNKSHETTKIASKFIKVVTRSRMSNFFLVIWHISLGVNSGFVLLFFT